LKLMNSVLLSRNRWKSSPHTLVPLAGDMGTSSHTFSSCPEATASSPRAGLRLNVLWLGSCCTAVLESSSATRATVGASRCCLETRFVTVLQGYKYNTMIWGVLAECRNYSVGYIGFQKTLRLNVKRFMRNKMRMFLGKLCII
jgi:hypothetical protein